MGQPTHRRNPMKIGIIGAGFVGRTLGKLAAQAGHEVMLSNSRGPHTLYSTRPGTGCQIGTVSEAIAFADVVVVAIPLQAYRTLPAEALAGKLVIDTCNYYPERDGLFPELERRETTTSELVAAHLSGSRIVKAFNAIKMGDMETAGRPAGHAERRALPLAGDDADDKALVAALYEQFGFDVVDAGPLATGSAFERGTPPYCVPLSQAALRRMLAMPHTPT
ncbi:NADPH-dependent F420 reductase [Paludibacterium sp.]|uniref:NADPH-dependent F420 reductase n=1 Tax=Paludibacterium sp. TaxID=1917523 RepID=UPI0025F91F01|nr:NADPH-dependent F420 reductase [Paludibacterium sp.]